MSGRLRELADEARTLERRLREGGGPARIAKQHEQGKLTARERVTALCDEGAHFLEVGLLVAHDQYDGGAPGAGVVTGVGLVHGRDDILVTGGGIIPKEDMEALEKMGTGRLFGPGTPTSDLVDYIRAWFAERERQEA